ncbi:ATP-binding protein [Streptomyces sp. ACA25]|uniref:sensor histidine kinase n=1 Tax=Streptomyces sp. ACA25 TaxID=3022596 RepID=UPI002307A326|nr:ATP-binding protein [Streptomyces sp. ACA25]MDB1088158.1 ATP-binding protein [Streptomyces sp. ACA25]
MKSAHTPPARPWTERPPLRQSLLVLLVSVAVSGSATLWGVYAAPATFQVPLAWGAGAAALLLCAAAVVTSYHLQKSALLRVRVGALEQETARLAAEHEAQVRHLADETVPVLVRQLRNGASPDTALANTPRPAHDAHARVLRQLAEEVGRGASARAAAMAACANAAGRMQALATSMLADLRDMEHRHSDQDVLGDLLHLDHRTAQAGRLADSIAVLTGARSGRRWAKPIVMESVLRGAMGRISGYQRIRLHSATNIAVAGHAAEGVMHALAELLDNAANFSPPTAEVHVYVEEVPAGVIITVEDSGLVMGDVALRRAERAVSSAPLDLTTLSGTRLGLAVVGCLARKHHLSVSFRPSARGGTGALVRIPQELITRPQQNVPQAPQERPGQPYIPDNAAPLTSGTVPRAAEQGPSARGIAEQAVPQPRTPARPAPGAGSPLPGTVGSGHDTGSHRTGEVRVPAQPSDDFPGHSGAEHTTAGPEPSDASRHDTAQNLPEFGSTGLPKRRRGHTLASAHPQTPKPQPSAGSPGTTHSPAASAARFGAFRRAVQGRDTAADTPSSSHPEDGT